MGAAAVGTTMGGATSGVDEQAEMRRVRSKRRRFIIKD
jgi:hypothetical protein